MFDIIIGYLLLHKSPLVALYHFLIQRFKIYCACCVQGIISGVQKLNLDNMLPASNIIHNTMVASYMHAATDVGMHGILLDVVVPFRVIFLLVEQCSYRLLI